MGDMSSILLYNLKIFEKKSDWMAEWLALRTGKLGDPGSIPVAT